MPSLIFLKNVIHFVIYYICIIFVQIYNIMYNPFEENPPKNKFKGFNPFAPNTKKQQEQLEWEEWLQNNSGFNDPSFEKGLGNEVDLNYQKPDYMQSNEQNPSNFLDMYKKDSFLYETSDPNNQTPVDKESHPLYEKFLKEKKGEKSNFWEMLGNNPYLMSGAPTSLEDRFGIAGAIAGRQTGNTTGKALGVTGGVASGVIGAARSFMSGMSLSKEYDRVQQDYYKNIKRGQEGHYQFRENGGTIPLFENGGFLDLPAEKLATNEYTAALPKAMQHLANAETEKNEWLITPNQEVKKVLGERHENGGVKQFLEGGTKIISDNLKIGKDVAEVVKDRLGIKLKPNQTYASAIDAYTKNIGLADLTKELEDIHKKLKNNASLKDEQTQKINEKFLTGVLQKLEEKRAPLSEKRLMFSETLFAAQELTKEIPTYRNGGTHLDQNIAALMRKHNIPLDQGAQILRYMQEGGEMNPQMIQQMMMQGQEQQGQAIIMVNPQTGETVEITSQEEYEVYAQQGYVTMEEFQMMQQQGMEGEEVMMEDGGEMEQLMTGVIDMLMQGAQPEEVLQELLKMGMDEQTATQVIQQAAQMASQGGQPQQEEMMMNGGEKKYVPSYNNGGEKPTWGAGSDESIAKLKEYLKHYKLEDDLKILNEKGKEADLSGIADRLQKKIIDVNPELVIDYMLNVVDLNKKLKDKYATKEQLKEAYKKNPEQVKKDIKDGFNDKMWWYRAPIDEVKTLSPEKYKAKMEELKDEGITQGDYKFRYDKDTGKYIRYVSDDNVVDGAVDDGKKAADNSQSKIDPFSIDYRPKPRMYSPVPMPFNLPPSALQAHAMTRYSPEQIDAVQIDPNIQPILDTQAANINMSEDMPIGLRMAMASNIGGTSAKNVADYLSKTDQTNLMNKQAVEEKNVMQNNTAEMFRAREIPRYEQLSLTAEAKTNNDLNNYFAAQDSNRLKKHQYMTNRALIEDLFDNVYYDPTTGGIKSDTRGAKFNTSKIG